VQLAAYQDQGPFFQIPCGNVSLLAPDDHIVKFCFLLLLALAGKDPVGSHAQLTDLGA